LEGVHHVKPGVEALPFIGTDYIHDREIVQQHSPASWM
jgi:hypothetical protein